MRGQLSRKEIVRECGFAKSVLLQNPRVKDALRTEVMELRGRLDRYRLIDDVLSSTGRLPR